jgi:SRSO17 transposase
VLTEDDLHAMLPELEAFHARFGGFFPRSESRAWSQKYLTGLLLPIERKNVENLAEQVGGHPRRLQEFVSESPWDDEGCVEEVQRLVGEQLGTGEGVLVLDDTGFPKRGKCSAGVGRQYSATLGRTDNCQVGVFVSYASEKGHTLVDRRLYLLRSWFEKEAVVSPKAGLPAGLEFRTKPELATQMLRKITKAGHLPYRWVTADADYGDHHDLRQAVADLGAWYCFDVSSTAKVWTGSPRRGSSSFSAAIRQARGPGDRATRSPTRTCRARRTRPGRWPWPIPASLIRAAASSSSSTRTPSCPRVTHRSRGLPAVSTSCSRSRPWAPPPGARTARPEPV